MARDDVMIAIAMREMTARSAIIARHPAKTTG